MQVVIPLSNQCYRIIRDKDQVKDVMQDVFVSLYEKKDSLPFDLEVVSYLARSIRYKAVNILRDKLVHEKHHRGLRYLQKDSADQSEEIELRELKTAIRKNIDGLPEKTREAMILKHYDNLSYRAIAFEMGISEKTVEKHIRNAFRHLKANLKKQAD